MVFEKIQAAGAAAGRAKRLGQPWTPPHPRLTQRSTSSICRKMAAHWWHGFTLAYNDCTLEELMARPDARDAIARLEAGDAAALDAAAEQWTGRPGPGARGTSVSGSAGPAGP